MTSVVVLVEEESAKIVVETLAKRIAPNAVVRVLGHEGKSDLRASLTRTIQSWHHPADVPFIVLQDQDSADCIQLKSGLVQLVPASRRSRTSIRIVVRELEAWYLGDLQAVEAAGGLKHGMATRIENKQKFRNPEALSNAKEEFFKIASLRGQLATARAVSAHMRLDGNRCASFGHFVKSLTNVLLK